MHYSLCIKYTFQAIQGELHNDIFKIAVLIDFSGNSNLNSALTLYIRLLEFLKIFKTFFFPFFPDFLTLLAPPRLGQYSTPPELRWKLLLCELCSQATVEDKEGERGFVFLPSQGEDKEWAWHVAVFSLSNWIKDQLSYKIADLYSECLSFQPMRVSFFLSSLWNFESEVFVLQMTQL